LLVSSPIPHDRQSRLSQKNTQHTGSVILGTRRTELGVVGDYLGPPAVYRTHKEGGEVRRLTHDSPSHGTQPQ
jgi:hypothetical protein